MANEALPEQVITITRLSQFEDLGAFYLQKKYSDVTLIVEGKEIHAHKIVLAARCKYFERLLPDDPTMTTLTIDSASFETFRGVLKYIYTGDISIETSNEESILDVIRLAHEYSLSELENTISRKIDSFLDISNVFKILNKANEYDFDEVKETCHVFMKKNFSQIFKNDFLNSLTQKSMMNLLEKRPFSIPEIDFFKIVEKWCNANEDIDNLVKNCLRLTEVSSDDLLAIVWPSKLLEEANILKALAKIKENGLLVMDKNIATAEFNARVVTGIRTSNLFMNNDFKKCAYHTIGDKNGITVDLGKIFRFNNIKLRLKDHKTIKETSDMFEYTDINFYRYYIEASKDQKNWKTILDYTKYDCVSHQNLYFEKEVARYIRIVGTYSSESTIFEVVSLEIYCKSATPQIKNQIVRPIENVASPQMGAFVAKGRWSSNLLNGNLSSGVTWHKIGSEDIIIQLAQPYVISSMRLLLFCQDNKSNKYSYLIETSMDGIEWQIAADKRHHHCKKWQDLQFDERPVTYVKITGTFSSANGVHFDCLHFECPSTKKGTV